MMCWAWKALNVFLDTALQDLTLSGQGASSNTLSCEIKAQLQQSGLLEQFSSTLQTTEQLVKDAAAAAGASGHGAPPGSARGQAASAAAITVSDSPSTYTVLLLCGELALAFHLVRVLEPQVEPHTEAATLDAAVSFCLAAMRLVTAEVDSLLARTTGPVVLEGKYLIAIAKTATGLLQALHAVQDSSGERLVQRLRSPNIREAVRVVTSVWYARTLMPSISGTRGDASTPSAVAASAAAAAQRLACCGWQAAARGCTPLQPPQQQPQQQQRQQQLKQQQRQRQQQSEPCQQATEISLHAAAWAAASLDSTYVSQAAFMAIQSTANLVLQFVDAVKQQLHQWQWQQQQQHMADIMAQEAEEVLVLLQLVLCSLEQQPGLVGSHYDECAVTVADATIKAISLPDDAMEAVMAGLEQGGSFAAAASAAAAPAGQGAAATLALAQLSESMGYWSAHMLPTLLALLQHRQQLILSTRTAQAAADSSSSSQNTSAQLDDARPCADDVISRLVSVLSVAAKYAAPMRTGVVQSAPLQRLLRTSWSQHCIPICAALDSCFRSQSGSSGGLRDASASCRLVQCTGLGLRPSKGPVAAAAVLAGPGSAEQAQLFSMLVSLLKVCGALSADAGVGASLSERLSLQQAAGDGCIQTALTAAGCLSHGCDPLPGTHSSTGGMTACDAAGSSAAAAAAAAGQTEAAAATAAATPINSLPALVLCGRCCLQWASQLHLLQQQTPDLGERLLLLKQVGADNPAGAAELLQVPYLGGPHSMLGGPHSMQHVWFSLLGLRRWLLGCCGLAGIGCHGVALQRPWLLLAILPSPPAKGGCAAGTDGAACCTRCCSCSSSV